MVGLEWTASSELSAIKIVALNALKMYRNFPLYFWGVSDCSYLAPRQVGCPILSGFCYHTWVGCMGKASPVFFGGGHVWLNGGWITHILAWKVGPSPCRNPEWVKSQHIVFHPNLWWLCIWIPGLPSGEGCVVYQNNLRQNLLSPGLMWWGNLRVSIFLECYFMDGIRMDPCVGLDHHLKFSLPVAVHIFFWFLSQIYTQYVPCPIGYTHSWIPWVSWMCGS